MGKPRWRFVLLSLCAAATGSSASEPAGAANAANDAQPAEVAARWQGAGLTVEVTASRGADVPAEQMAALSHVLIGAVALPVTALLAPIAMLGVPFYMLLAPTAQAGFNAQADALAKVLASQSLPAAVVESVRARWPPAASGPAVAMRIRVVGYGLGVRSARPLQALEAREPLCLVAEAQLEWQQAGSPAHEERLSIGFDERSPDAPPPYCAPMSQLAEADGSLMRRALLELGEVLGAMAVSRVEAAS